MRRRILSRVLPLLLALASAPACEDVDPLGPRAELDPFVGAWQAESVEVAFDEPGLAPFELIASGGSFFLDVQPSGLFTASATFRLSTVTRLGRRGLDGDSIVFDVDVPAPDSERLAVERSGGRLLLTGRPFLIRGIRKKLPVVGAVRMELVRIDGL